MYRLFIVEDDPGIANAVAAQAQAWNLQTHIVQDFSNVMHEFAEFSPHIVLLDIMLPFFDGYHWCSEIRRVSKVPIIFVSSASDNMNIVMAMTSERMILSRSRLTAASSWRKSRLFCAVLTISAPMFRCSSIAAHCLIRAKILSFSAMKR